MSREQILHELSETLDRAKEKLDALEPESKEIYIHCTGIWSTYYRVCFRESNLQPKAYLDNDVSKHGTKFDGVEVIAPESIVDKDNALVLICSPRPQTNAAVMAQLDALGLKHLGIDAYLFPLHAAEIMQCAERLDDDKSVSVYAKMIKIRMAPECLLNTRECIAPFEGNKYFALPPFHRPSPKEVVVDCGAYVGDSLEHYLFVHEGIGQKFYLFEPSEKNIRALKARCRRLKEEWALDDEQFVIAAVGVGRKTETKYFKNKTYGSVVINESDESIGSIDIVALDEYFADQRITFLKSDIEGAEFDMLHGAERIIRRDRPKLALCIYHNAFDVFRIQLWLDSLGLGYKFAVRQHSYGIGETVLYAWQ